MGWIYVCCLVRDANWWFSQNMFGCRCEINNISPRTTPCPCPLWVYSLAVKMFLLVVASGLHTYFTKFHHKQGTITKELCTRYRYRYKLRYSFRYEIQVMHKCFWPDYWSDPHQLLYGSQAGNVVARYARSLALSLSLFLFSTNATRSQKELNFHGAGTYSFYIAAAVEEVTMPPPASPTTADSQPTASRQPAAVWPRIDRMRRGERRVCAPQWNKCVRFKNKLKIMFLLYTLSRSLQLLLLLSLSRSSRAHFPKGSQARTHTHAHTHRHFRRAAGKDHCAEYFSNAASSWQPVSKTSQSAAPIADAPMPQQTLTKATATAKERELGRAREREREQQTQRRGWQLLPVRIRILGPLMVTQSGNLAFWNGFLYFGVPIQNRFAHLPQSPPAPTPSHDWPIPFRTNGYLTGVVGSSQHLTSSSVMNLMSLCQVCCLGNGTLAGNWASYLRMYLPYSIIIPYSIWFMSLLCTLLSPWFGSGSKWILLLLPRDLCSCSCSCTH